MKPGYMKVIILILIFLVFVLLMAVLGAGQTGPRATAAVLFTVAFFCLAALRLRGHQRASKKQKRHASTLAAALRKGALNRNEPAGRPSDQCVME